MTTRTPGHPLFHDSYRPFFLAAMIHAVIMMMFWQIDYLQGYPLQSIYGPQGWHAHEMISGFAIAFLSGFLLHATKNWTGIASLKGTGLFMLVALWTVGRFLPFFPDAIPAALAGIPDLLFLLLLTALVAAPLIERHANHAYALVELLLVLSVGAIITFWADSGWLPDASQQGERLMFYATVTILIVLAGKLIPGFTEQTLGVEIRKQQYDGLVDDVAVASLYVLMVLQFFVADGVLTALVATGATIANVLRLKRWYHSEIWQHPLLWILYSGYGWISAGLALSAVGMIGVVPMRTGFHALGIGGIGILAAGMMSRVILANSHNKNEADSWLVLAFILLNTSASTLVILPLILPDMLQTWLLTSGMCWVGAFSVLIWRFFPLLMQPVNVARDQLS